MITAYNNIQINKDEPPVYEEGVFEEGVYQ